MKRLATYVVLGSTLALLIFVVAPVPGHAMCGDCALTSNGYFCVSNPPTYAVCRAWGRTEYICYAWGCFPHEMEYCEAYAECAY